MFPMITERLRIGRVRHLNLYAVLLLALMTLMAGLVPAMTYAPTAAADTCQTCPPPPEDETTGAPGPGPRGYRVTVNEVHAYVNNDNDIQWADEVYVKFNQWTFWGPTRIEDQEWENGSAIYHNDDTTRYPNVSWGFIGGSVDVHLWDEDNTSADDHLGSVTLGTSGVSWTPVTSTLHLYDSGAHYRIKVTVVRIN